jgi:hypothetical protein
MCSICLTPDDNGLDSGLSGSKVELFRRLKSFCHLFYLFGLFSLNSEMDSH